jgi:hypothetical protein
MDSLYLGDRDGGPTQRSRHLALATNNHGATTWYIDKSFSYDLIVQSTTFVESISVDHTSPKCEFLEISVV